MENRQSKICSYKCTQLTQSKAEPTISVPFNVLLKK